VQIINMVTSRLPTVDRPVGDRHVYLTFEGLSDARATSDRHTRARIAVAASELPRLYDLLAPDEHGHDIIQ